MDFKEGNVVESEIYKKRYVVIKQPRWVREKYSDNCFWAVNLCDYEDYLKDNHDVGIRKIVFNYEDFRLLSETINDLS